MTRQPLIDRVQVCPSCHAALTIQSELCRVTAERDALQERLAEARDDVTISLAIREALTAERDALAQRLAASEAACAKYREAIDDFPDSKFNRLTFEGEQVCYMSLDQFEECKSLLASSDPGKPILEKLAAAEQLVELLRCVGGLRKTHANAIRNAMAAYNAIK